MAKSIDWRERWPEFVVQRQTEPALADLNRYYEKRDDGRPAYTGSRFEAIARLTSDPNRIGPADLVAITTLSVDLKGKAAVRILERDAERISVLLERIPADLDIVDAAPELLAAGSSADDLWKALRRGWRS